MSDVILDSDEQVTVLCSNLNVQGHDFILDSAERRKPGGPRFRRALVHDQNDGLTINFAGDYPGGVTFGGVASFTTLQVRGDITFGVPGVTQGGHGTVQNPTAGGSTQVPASLNGEFAKLHSQISALSARVVVLEAKK